MTGPDGPSRRPDGVAGPDGLRPVEVLLPGAEAGLPGTLTAPHSARGAVVFVHGSGSSRHSPRNRQVADRLHRANLATLLFDLLTPDEGDDPAKVFDIDLLAARLAAVTAWTGADPRLAGLPLGYFGASTGAAAALRAAAGSPQIGAVVSRGGRPDLADADLPAVRAPTLLLVGERDPWVLQVNRQAQERLHCPHQLVVVPSATHLFAEPGTLERVADLAAGWFTRHLHPHGV